MSLHPALLALGVVLAASAGHADRELVIRWPSGVELRMCAKAALPRMDACEDAAARRWQPVGLPDIATATFVGCLPHPDCFDQRSLCIQGYSCP